MTNVRIAAIRSVCIAQTDPFGTSRRGSIDSSAARGTSSIARKNQIANGKDLKIPLNPNGNHGPPPPGISPPPFAMFVHREKSSFPEKIAAMKKNTRTAIDRDGDRHREAHRGLDPDDVDPDEDDVEDRPPERQAVPPWVRRSR